MALPTCEAEYIATTVATQGAKFLKQIVTDIEIAPLKKPLTLFVDNQSAIVVAKDPIRNQMKKHIDITYHFIPSEIKSGNIILQCVSSQENLPDIFTIPMTRPTLQTLLKTIMTVL